MENNGDKQEQRLLVETIKDQMERNFYNLEISMKTCDRDVDLYEKPEACSYTRMQIILGQMRHFMAHVGIFNGITIAHTGRYPMCIGLTGEMDGRLWDE